MSIDSRLTRLRALVEQVERLPASPRRQWMLSEARARVVDVETGEAPRGMRPLAADAPARSAQQALRAIDESEPAKRTAAHCSPQAEPAGETPVEPGRIEPDTSANQGAAPGLRVDESVVENTFIARPDASTPPLVAEVLWAEDWQADASPAAQAGDGDAESRPWRFGLRG
jgi:hypothetical protein